jgi:transposase
MHSDCSITLPFAVKAIHLVGKAVDLPARPRKPRDKAKVEVGVQIVERWVLARLRKMTFFSLVELNAAIKPLIDRLNHKPFKKTARIASFAI